MKWQNRIRTFRFIKNHLWGGGGGGAPAAVKIPSCADSSSVNENAGTDFVKESNLSHDDEFSDDSFETNRHSSSENTDDFVKTNNEPSSGKGANETRNSGVNKRKRKSDNIIPKLIDNKRAHLEKKLSVSQRDSILLAEAQEDVALRREIINSINNSNEIFSNAIAGITDSIKMLSETLVKSMEPIAQCLNFSQTQVPVMQAARPRFQLNTAQVVVNFVNKPPTQNTQNFLQLLNSSTRGDGNINENSDVFCLLLCKSEDITLGIINICTMSVSISQAVPQKCFYGKVFWKIYSTFTVEHSRQRVVSINLQSKCIEIKLCHEFLSIFAAYFLNTRIPLHENTNGALPVIFVSENNHLSK